MIGNVMTGLFGGALVAMSVSVAGSILAGLILVPPVGVVATGLGGALLYALKGGKHGSR
jgi:hypothetical protein